jgi:parvulin-like peptidyl-prolyl isomerase
MMATRTIWRWLAVLPAAYLFAQAPPRNPSRNALAVPGASTEKPGNAAVPPDTVVLTAGGANITAAQFELIVAALPASYQAQVRGPGRKQFADTLAQMLVLAQEGRRRHLDETPAFQAQTLFQTANALAALTFQQISKETQIPETELRKYYGERQKDFEEVHARHILIRMKGSPLPLRPGQNELTEEEALAKAHELRKKLLEGADFGKLAQEASDDTGSASRGGDLDFFRHNQMAPAFEEAAFQLSPGEVSEPVKTIFGYHLIRVEAKRTKSFEDARAEIERKLRPERTKKVLDELEKEGGVVLNPQFFGGGGQ